MLLKLLQVQKVRILIWISYHNSLLSTTYYEIQCSVFLRRSCADKVHITWTTFHKWTQCHVQIGFLSGFFLSEMEIQENKRPSPRKSKQLKKVLFEYLRNGFSYGWVHVHGFMLNLISLKTRKRNLYEWSVDMLTFFGDTEQLF